MATKILQLVNSVTFGLRVKINDPVRAAVYLGLDMIRGLVLSAIGLLALGGVYLLAFGYTPVEVNA